MRFDWRTGRWTKDDGYGPDPERLTPPLPSHPGHYPAERTAPVLDVPERPPLPGATDDDMPDMGAWLVEHARSVGGGRREPDDMPDMGAWLAENVGRPSSEYFFPEPEPEPEPDERGAFADAWDWLAEGWDAERGVGAETWDSFLHSLTTGNVSMLGESWRGLGELFGSDAMRRGGRELVEWAEDLDVGRPASVSDVRESTDNAGTFMRYLGGAFGQGVGTILPVLGTAAAGAAAGAVAAPAALGVAAGVTAVRAGAMAGAMLGSFGLNYGESNGQIREELVDQGVEPDRASRLAARWSVPVGVVNAGLDSAGALITAAGFRVPKEAVKRGIVSRVARGAAQGVKAEGATEFMQTVTLSAAAEAASSISGDQSQGPEFADRAWDAVNAAIMGAVTGGGVGAVSGLAPDRIPEAEPEAAPLPGEPVEGEFVPAPPPPRGEVAEAESAAVEAEMEALTPEDRASPLADADIAGGRAAAAAAEVGARVDGELRGEGLPGLGTRVVAPGEAGATVEGEVVDAATFPNDVTGEPERQVTVRTDAGEEVFVAGDEVAGLRPVEDQQRQDEEEKRAAEEAKRERERVEARRAEEEKRAEDEAKAAEQATAEEQKRVEDERKAAEKAAAEETKRVEAEEAERARQSADDAVADAKIQTVRQTLGEYLPEAEVEAAVQEAMESVGGSRRQALEVLNERVKREKAKARAEPPEKPAPETPPEEPADDAPLGARAASEALREFLSDGEINALVSSVMRRGGGLSSLADRGREITDLLNERLKQERAKARAKPPEKPPDAPAAEPETPTPTPTTPEPPAAEPEPETEPPAAEAEPEPAAAEPEPETPAAPEPGETVDVRAEADLRTAEAAVEPEPSEAQAEAGNYRKGHVRVHGLDVSIETAKGGVRRGTSPTGEAWEVTMPAAYGYVRRTTGADGDQVDVYVGDSPESERVFIVDQVDADSKAFDEHKVMVGFRGRREALEAYDAAFDDGRGPERRGMVTAVTPDKLKEWLATGDTGRPYSPKLAEKPPDAPAAEPETPTPPATTPVPAEAVTGEPAAPPPEGAAAPPRRKLRAPTEADVKRVRSAEYGAQNKVVTRERMEVLRRRFAEKTRQLGAGVDPEMLAITAEMAAFHFEAGARKFRSFARAVTADLGDAVRPYLRAMYNSMRGFPGLEEFEGELTADDLVRKEVESWTAAPAAEEEVVDEAVGEPAEPGRPAPGGRAPGDVRDDGEGAGAVDEGPAEPGAVPEEEGDAARGAGGRGRADVGHDGRPDRGGRAPVDGDRGGEPGAPVAPGRGRGPAAGGVAGTVRPAESAQDFRLAGDEADALVIPGQAARAAANIEAIELLAALEKGERPATRAEQMKLMRYAGWGGLKQVFDESPKASWARKTKARLQELLTKEEFEAAHTSVLNAHYTSPAVVRAIWQALASRSGLGRGGRELIPHDVSIYEPAAGSGLFAALSSIVPGGLGRWAFGERDRVSARLLTQLYPSSQVMNAPFEEVGATGPFDMVITNVPFSEIKPFDPVYNPDRSLVLHDFFIVKSLAMVRPGGLVVAITSSGTLDKRAPEARERMAALGDLVSAVRLPSDAFKENAGADVVTDLLVFRRRAEGEEAGGQAFRRSDFVGVLGGEVHLNEYYVAHPDHVLGDMSMRSGRYGDKPELDVRARGDFDAKAIASALFPDMRALREHKTLPVSPVMPQLMVWRPSAPDPTKEPVKELAELERIRGTLAELTKAQIDSPETAETLRARLNAEYDEFTRSGERTLHRVILEDAPELRELQEIYALLALEVERPGQKGRRSRRLYDKADIFTQATAGEAGRESVETTSEAREALAMALNRGTRVDMAYIAERMGTTPAKAAKALQGAVFDVPFAEPRERWQTAEEYLSGDVVKKLDVAREAGEKFAANVAALEKVQPKRLDADEISFSPSHSYVKLEDIRDFAAWVMEVPSYYIQVGKQRSGRGNVRSDDYTWHVHGGGVYDSRDAITRYGTKVVPFGKQLSLLLEGRMPSVTVEVEGKRVVDPKETRQALRARSRVVTAWEEWARSEKNREAYVEKYNAAYNRHVIRKYDGSHLTLPGLSPTFTPRPSQLDAIWRTLITPSIYLAHEVGVGKTFETVGAVMEIKRMGLAAKPMIVVPKKVMEGFAKEAREYYPGVRIHEIPGGLGVEERDRRISAIATTSFDFVLTTRDVFNTIRVGLDSAMAARHGLLGVGEVDESGEKIRRQSPRDAARMREAVYQRLRERETRRERKSGTPQVSTHLFEDLGIDALVIDEAHYYRNMQVASRQHPSRGNPGIKGMGSESGNRMTEDFFAKVMILRAVGGKTIYASGTPIQNAPGEIYTTLRFLFTQSELRDFGIPTWDHFLAVYGSVGEVDEIDVAGGELSTRMKVMGFRNWPELMTFLHSAMDVRTAEQAGVVRPPIEGGGWQPHFLDPTPEQRDMQASLVGRVQAVRANPFDRSDNMLAVLTDGRKLSVDPRLLDATAQPGPKLSYIADRIKQIYDETAHFRGTQFFFTDLAKSTVTGFDAYNEMERLLVARGLPKKQIGRVGASDGANRKLFAKVNEGEVRVLFGSTEKGGTGVNVQRRMAAIHNADVSWHASGLIQRAGRGHRAGNIVYAEHGWKLRIEFYVTKGLTESFMWDKVRYKKALLEKALSTDFRDLREIDNLFDVTQDQADVVSDMASGAGSPEIKERQRLRLAVAGLMEDAEQHRREYLLQVSLVEEAEKSVTREENRLESRDLKQWGEWIEAVGETGDVVLGASGKGERGPIAKLDRGKWEKAVREAKVRLAEAPDLNRARVAHVGIAGGESHSVYLTRPDSLRRLQQGSELPVFEVADDYEGSKVPLRRGEGDQARTATLREVLAAVKRVHERNVERRQKGLDKARETVRAGVAMSPEFPRAEELLERNEELETLERKLRGWKEEEAEAEAEAEPERQRRPMPGAGPSRRRRVSEEKLARVSKEIEALAKRLLGDQVRVVHDPKLGPGEGGYAPAERVIRLAYDAHDAPQTLRHEVIEWLYDVEAVLPSVDKQLRESAQAKWIDKYQIPERYPGSDPAQQEVEAIAEAYADWSKGATAPWLSAPLARFFRAVRRFLRGVVRIVVSAGYRRPEDFFEQVETGQVQDPELGLAVSRETREAWERSRGKAREQAWLEWLGEWSGRFVQGFTRQYQAMPRTAEFAAAHEALREIPAAVGVASESIRRRLEEIVRPLSARQYDTFRAVIVFEDLLYDSEERQLAVPFRHKETDIVRAYESAKARADADPAITRALALRRSFADDERRKSVESGLLTKAQGENSAYYRHQVLAYAQARDQAGTGSSELRMPRLFARRGTAKAINTEYVEAEVEWLFHHAKGRAEVAAIEKLRQRYDRMPQLREEIRKRNAAAFARAKAKFDKEQMRRSNRIAGKIGYGVRTLRQHVGEIPLDSLHGRARATARAIGRGKEVPGEDLFDLVSAVLGQDDNAATVAARTVIAGLAERRTFMREVLGEEYLNPLAPGQAAEKIGGPYRGYRLWQPKKGNVMFVVKSIPEHVADRLMEQATRNLAGGTIPAEDVAEALALTRDVLVRGGPLPSLLLPTELADTLEHVSDPVASSVLGRAMYTMLRRWKVWRLMEPTNIVKYNLMNLSGDVDFILGTFPGALRMKYVSRAVKETWQVQMRDAPPSDEYRMAAGGGVFGGGQVRAELELYMGDLVNDLDRPGMALPAKAVRRTWRAMKDFTAWRESTLRYSLFLYGLERDKAIRAKLEKEGRKVTERAVAERFGYGASNAELVYGLEDPVQRIAHIARTTVGDYAAMSTSGHWLRSFAIPFWSWNEVVFRHYANVAHNLWRLGGQSFRDRDLNGAGVVGARAGLAAAGLAIRTGLFMGIWYGVWRSFQHFYADEGCAEEIPSGRLSVPVHCDDGKVLSLRAPGALADGMSWLGWPDIMETFDHVERGRADWSEAIWAVADAAASKAVNSISPLYKVPAELLTGMQTFPSIRERRAIRNRGDHILRAVGLIKWADALRGRPSEFGHLWTFTAGLVLDARDEDRRSYLRSRAREGAYRRGVLGIKTRVVATEGDELLRLWGVAVRLKDKRAEAKLAEQIREWWKGKPLAFRITHGRSLSHMKRGAIVRARPLSSLPRFARARFLASLDERERADYKRAMEYWQKTFLRR